MAPKIESSAKNQEGEQPLEKFENLPPKKRRSLKFRLVSIKGQIWTLKTNVFPVISQAVQIALDRNDDKVLVDKEVFQQMKLELKKINNNLDIQSQLEFDALDKIEAKTDLTPYKGQYYQIIVTIMSK